MTLDAYVKKDTCDGGYFQGDETFYVFDVDVDAASSLQEFGEKNMKYSAWHWKQRQEQQQQNKFLWRLE